MPNHVINKLYVSPKVRDFLRGDGGQDVDFNKVIPIQTTAFSDEGWVTCSAEDAAKALCGKRNVLFPFTHGGRPPPPDFFAEVHHYVQNFIDHGFFNPLSEQIEKWDTKWNAYDIDASDEDHLKFETAWSVPEPIYVALSKIFPEEEILVIWADEDIGSNCGKVLYKNGVLDEANSERADHWSSMSADQKAKWRTFALEVWGRDESYYDGDE